jgi:hypothetical protein
VDWPLEPEVVQPHSATTISAAKKTVVGFLDISYTFFKPIMPVNTTRGSGLCKRTTC